MSVLVIPTGPLEKQLWIRMQLGLRGLSLADVGRAHGWSRRVMSSCLRQPCYPQEKALADILGVEVRDLFPERYAADGTRLHPIRGEPSSESPAFERRKTGSR